MPRASSYEEGDSSGATRDPCPYVLLRQRLQGSSMQGPWQSLWHKRFWICNNYDHSPMKPFGNVRLKVCITFPMCPLNLLVCSNSSLRKDSSGSLRFHAVGRYRAGTWGQGTHRMTRKAIATEGLVVFKSSLLLVKLILTMGLHLQS